MLLLMKLRNFPKPIISFLKYLELIIFTIYLSLCHYMGFPGGSAGKESSCNVGDLGFIPGLGRSPGEGNSYPLQYSGLENSMDCIVYGVAKSQTGLSDLLHFMSLYNKVLKILLYFSRYCTVRFKMFSLFSVFVFLVLFV